ncbi:unnamed protein product [Ceutorhynchus assimilis]|uniref:Uncharacterized protein n=1 Tax=Ceutorhynchus assimilis TaxID=467358 RepID=A0A9N9MJS6_9CUCU|nr:unnamed protein product [Ceutorhynchus assimilis]
MNSCPQKQRENHQSESQAFVICSGTYKEFYDSLRLKKEVLNKMRVDEVSKVVMSDILICSYGESQLKRHKRVQLATMVSNKLRELGRLLLVLKEMTGCHRFLDILKPEFFDNLVTATKVISGYNEANKNFRAPSLALHMSTRLVQVCDIATKLIIKKHRFLECKDPEATLKNIKRLRSLIVGHWNSEISSLALKDLNEKQWEKPKMYPLTSEIMQFQKYVINEAENACANIEAKRELEVNFRRLTECIMALTLLLNRKRIGEIQFLKKDTYQNDIPSNHQQEIIDSLTENEKILTRNFKRVVTGGKGSKPVVILFPKKIQSLIDFMLSVRSECVSKENNYLFANPKTDSRWLSGYHVLKKLAQQSGVSNKDLFTSTRLRKQIATVLQVMNIGESEMEQFANFMGHTKKTHEEYYRLPQDVYQTAKVSKILIVINNGKGAQYKGKTLDEIDLSDNVDSDNSDHEDANVSATKRTIKRSKTRLSESPSAAYDVPGPSRIYNEPVTIPAVTEKRIPYSDSSKYSSGSSADGEICEPQLKRKAWNETQAKILRSFFAKHIKEKIAPKKHEVELLIKEYPKVFKGRKWVTIKANLFSLNSTAAEVVYAILERFDLLGVRNQKKSSSQGRYYSAIQFGSSNRSESGRHMLRREYNVRTEEVDLEKEPNCEEKDHERLIRKQNHPITKAQEKEYLDIEGSENEIHCNTVFYENE